MTYLENKEMILSRCVTQDTETVNLLERYFYHLKRFLLAIEQMKENDLDIDMQPYYTVLNKIWDRLLDKGTLPEDILDFGDCSFYKRYKELLEGVV